MYSVAHFLQLAEGWWQKTRTTECMMYAHVSQQSVSRRPWLLLMSGKCIWGGSGSSCQTILVIAEKKMQMLPQFLIFLSPSSILLLYPSSVVQNKVNCPCCWKSHNAFFERRNRLFWGKGSFFNKIFCSEGNSLTECKAVRSSHHHLWSSWGAHI